MPLRLSSLLKVYDILVKYIHETHSYVIYLLTKRCNIVDPYEMQFSGFEESVDGWLLIKS